MSELSRREFNKSMLATLGGGSILLLFGIQSAGGSGQTVFDSVNPTEVDASGIGPGTLTIAARRDHLHRLRNPLTGPVQVSQGSSTAIAFGTISGSSSTVDILQSGTIQWESPVDGFTHIKIFPQFSGGANPRLTISAPFFGEFARLGLLGSESGAVHRIFKSNAGKIQLVDINDTILMDDIIFHKSRHAVGGGDALTGAIFLINIDETQANATVPNADTVVKTFTLAANAYSKIIVEAEGYGIFGALSTNQVVNIKIKFAGAQIGQTMKLDAALGAASNIPFPVKASAAFPAGGAIDVTIGAAVADANTTFFLNSLRIYGVI